MTLTVGEYDLREPLGSGEYFNVFEAQHQHTHERVALKMIRDNKLHCANTQGQAYTEAKILQNLQHPNIVKLVSVIPHRQRGQLRTVLALENCVNGELFHVIEKLGALNESLARNILKQIVMALNYCHKTGVAHRDIKPEQILFDDDYRVKIVDWGFAHTFHDDDDAYDNMRCGSETYMPAEVLGRNHHDHNHNNNHDHNNSSLANSLSMPNINATYNATGTTSTATVSSSLSCGNHISSGSSSTLNNTHNNSGTTITHRHGFDTRKMDVWSTGITLFVMVCGFPPFYRAELSDQYFHIFCYNKTRFWNIVEKRLCSRLSDSLKDLLTSMIQVDVNQRLTMEQILQHKWLQEDIASNEEVVAMIQRCREPSR